MCGGGGRQCAIVLSMQMSEMEVVWLVVLQTCMQQQSFPSVGTRVSEGLVEEVKCVGQVWSEMQWIRCYKSSVFFIRKL